ncbi:hypothetical protein F5Y14DRAFT_429300 [Nemania sp. NC0429]|nr:hypothetical protein F5Y14DRAFT_429300 [Nemania sp. NC0429]
MDLVPPEILLHIFDYIDGPAPSEMRLHDQPSLDLLTTKPGRPGASLKAASLVSRWWRSLALPRLFRHVLWKPNVYSLSAFTLNPIPLLRFLTENHLARGVATFTVLIDFYDRDTADYVVAPQIRPVDLEWLWDQLFSVIDPLRFTVLARPTTLAALLSRMLYLDDAWSFDIPYHILSLARPNRQVPPGESSCHGRGSQRSASPSLAQPSSSAVGPQSSTLASSSVSRRPATSSTFRSRTAVPCPLFTVRPWTSLLLNEGSFDKVYRVYEFFLLRPPSILGALLGCEEYPNDAPLVPQTVVDFNYIAIFPLASHFEILLEHLPRIDRLFVQLVPKPGNATLKDMDEIKHIDPAVLWVERNTSYTFLMRQLTSVSNPQANWDLLQVVETGDAASDKEAWELAVRFFKNSGVQSWQSKREGVFVRHHDDSEFEDWSGEINGHVGGLANFSDPTPLSVNSFNYL